MGDRGSGRPTWAEIDLAALERNLAALRARAPGRRVIAVVKADGYGHGARAVGVTLVGAGVEALAVATVAEASELRAAGLETPVLLLQGLHAADEADYALECGLSCVSGRLDALAPLEAAARRAGRRFPVHLKFDTGMTRLGFRWDEVDAVLDRVLGSDALSVEGLMTHLAEADDPDSRHTEEQRRRFEGVVARAAERGLAPGWVHVDSSAAVLHGPTEGTTAIRPGLALYGADPTLDHPQPLDPVMSLCSRVLHAQDVPAGTRVGYGGTWIAERPSRIATVPVGYADGLPAAAATYRVGVGGRRFPLAGRVSMDLAAIEVGPDSGVGVGDEVLIFGRRHGLTLPVEELAGAAGTIAYEVLTGIGPRVPRVVVRRGG